MSFAGFNLKAFQGLRRNHEREGYDAVSELGTVADPLNQAETMVARLDPAFLRSQQKRRIILEVPPRRFTIDFTDWRGEKVFARNLQQVLAEVIKDRSKHHRIPAIIDWCLSLG